MIATNLLDLHFPVVAVQKKKSGAKGLESPKPLVYGTAFPVLPGVFATARHVALAADLDGIVALTRFVGAGKSLYPYPVTRMETIKDIDFALLVSPSLQSVIPLQLEFDQSLEVFDSVEATGFPMAVDPEWVSVIHRGFKGHVVTRRTMYQLPGQPPGYELSFPAPEGLSGAPLVSRKTGDHRCYGYVVQHSELVSGSGQIALGVAIDITVVLSIMSKLFEGPLATLFGRKPIPKPTPTPAPLPGGLPMNAADVEGWPDDCDGTESCES